jgi:hypothetical protein
MCTKKMQGLRVIKNARIAIFEGGNSMLTNIIKLLQLNIREGTRGGGHGT